jgi:hypothetical protein
MSELVSSSAIRVGAVRGRYFRENFAQGGIDLVQIVPELVTNADAAIAAAGPMLKARLQGFHGAAIGHAAPARRSA